MDGSSGTGSNANSSAGPFTSEESASQSHRQKADIAWAHVSEGVNAQGRKTMTCIYCHKTFAGGDSLQVLITSGDYKKFLKIDKGKEVKQIVLDEKFWNNYLITMRIMGQLIRLLHVYDTDERPSLGYVYEGMYRAINDIKKLFKNKERSYKPYTDIINERWDRMLRKNLQATAYYLNPAFQYDPTFSIHPEITNGLFDYIESKVDWCSLDVLTYEIGMFRDRQGSFGRKSAILSSQKNRPETPIGELDYDELEEELEELPIPLESSNFQQFEDDGDEAEPEDVNLDLFQSRSVLVDKDDWI
ncbi:hypothetical protein ZIOFF_015958 [Zingiber officinale]|uniref:Uncharacterized protein n=1 Tax=Zingiber officinale TaxID=94328 RepID=A0A8J5HRZ7_ZINOF|nr:hypothetical protein ZIOFF_015958 [Zingiber officinale]